MNSKLKLSFFSVFVMGSEKNADQDAISSGNATKVSWVHQ